MCGFEPVKIFISRKSKTMWTKKHPAMARSCAGNGAATQESMCVFVLTQDDECQKCGALGTEVHRLDECRHSIRIRSATRENSCDA